MRAVAAELRVFGQAPLSVDSRKRDITGLIGHHSAPENGKALEGSRKHASEREARSASLRAVLIF